MKINKFLPLIAACFLLAGCVEKEIIDDVNIETGIGYDLKEKEEFEGTIMVPIFKPDKNIGNFNYSATATSTRDLLQEIQRKSAQPIVTGSLEIAVFGEEMAKNGIIEVIDSFERDPSIGARVFLAVGQENAKDILTGTYGNRGNGIHLSDLIRHNMENKNLPETNLHLFLFDFYQKGKTPYLPILKKVEPEVIEIVGIALFFGDKMVDTVPPDKMFFFKLLTDKFSMGSFKVNIDNKHAAIKDLKSKHKIKLVKRDPYKILIEIKIEGVIREYTGEMLKPATIKKIEKNVEKQVNEEASKLITSFQEQGIDPLGLGNFVKSKTRGFDYNKWKDDYKNVIVQIKTDAVITEVGVVE